MEGLTTDYDPMDEDLDDTIIFDLVLEGDHTYTSFGSREYMLPNDDSWTLAEADLHHVIHNLVLDKKAFLGSAAAFEGRVLDVGTGIGLWAIDMADENPHADVIGIDLSPIQPEWVPPNCRFIMDDFVLCSEQIFACPDYLPEAVHCGNMTMAVYDWTNFVGWIKRELEPGGFVEFQELLWYPCIQDDGIVKPYTGPLAEFFQTLAQAFGAVEITLDAPRFIRTGLEQSGFKEVCQQEFLIPLGHWPKDPKSRNIGIYFYEFLRDAIEPLSSRVLRRGLNHSPSEAQTWVARFKETLEDSSRKMILFQFIVVHGRKPKPMK
ncbi:hypothetical protein NCS55_01410900 [Fusarium keratoplasticum]|nr:hypothetical protein NCS55_01410900 [Fusarium keratoplasticum]